MNRQFSYTHIVRYDECNCSALLTPTAFVRYMQGLAALDANDAQLSGNGYWVVKRTNISFTTSVSVHTRLLLKTEAIGFTRVTAQRRYEAHLADQPDAEPVISAHTLWVYVDPRGRPARLPAETAEIWLPDGPQPLLADTPLPALPDQIPETTTSVVRFSDIDLMRHLNNTSIVEMLDNAAWEAYAHNGLMPNTIQFDPLHYDIEYIDSPAFGDTLTIQSWFEPFPSIGQEFTLLQHITREGKTVARAHSLWRCRANA